MTHPLERASDELDNMPLLPYTDAEKHLRELLLERGNQRGLNEERAGQRPHFHYWEYDIYGEVMVDHTHPFDDYDHEHPNEQKPPRPDGSHPWDY
jgi:hypothetical protein